MGAIAIADSLMRWSSRDTGARDGTSLWRGPEPFVLRDLGNCGLSVIGIWESAEVLSLGSGGLVDRSAVGRRDGVIWTASTVVRVGATGIAGSLTGSRDIEAGESLWVGLERLVFRDLGD
jgi:hypothetical protein